MVTIQQIREVCYTSEKKKKSKYTRYIFREPSFYLTKLLLYTPITANQVTFLMWIVGFASAYFFLIGQYWYSIIGALLFQFKFLLDQVDGNIARFKGTTSIYGHYFDRMHHRVTEPLIFLAIGWGTGQFHIFLLSILIALSMTWFYLTISEKYRVFFENQVWVTKTNKNNIEIKKSSKIVLLGLAKRMHDKVGALIRPPGNINIVLIGAIINQLHLVIYLFALLIPMLAFGSFLYESMIRFKKFE